jgi:hypothetical protein
MPFSSAIYGQDYGTVWWATQPNTYCQNNTSASDYGKCYNIIAGKAIFIQTDTATYPTLPCESDNTCTRYTSTTGVRNLRTVFSYSGKQGIVQYFYTRSHAYTSQFGGNIAYSYFGMLIPTHTGDTDHLWFLPSPNYEVSSWPVYDPVANFKAYRNPYTISSGFVAILRWYGSFFTSQLYISAQERYQNNVWYAADIRIMWAYESSPLAVIPLDYDRDYVPYQELYSAFGFSINGVDQPGWNADDIMNVLMELFPDRAWAVFDDRTKTLHLYNLTPDYIPDWLIGKLVPVSMKVVKAPANAAVAEAWMNELNRRNVKIPA